MTRPRAQLISLEATPYYHYIARCVRRAWLCGTDRYSGKNFDHRKPWLLDRLSLLGEVFAIDIAAYAVMSNHYHVVLHVDTARGLARSDEDVIRQWTRLYQPDPGHQRKFAIYQSSTRVQASVSNGLQPSMTRPRAQLISLEATPYYHCIARCVRRAWLCGTDRYTGKNFEHRKPWLRDRLRLLGEIFAIDIAAYAVMSNHYHVVLHVDSARGAARSDDEVISHWTRLYTGPQVIQRYKAGGLLTEAEQELVRQLAERWRQRLTSISWFMRCLNEYLARRANAEDGCKGRFWEARFTSRALLDEAALLSCMAYVDLNPIRAGIASSLDESEFTSIQDRVRAVNVQRSKKISERRSTPRLMPFAEAFSEQRTFAAIPFNLQDYLELIEWTGRVVRHDKTGAIPPSAPRVLAQIGLTDTEWQLLTLSIQKEAIAMLNGLERVATLKQHERSKAA